MEKRHINRNRRLAAAAVAAMAMSGWAHTADATLTLEMTYDPTGVGVAPGGASGSASKTVTAVSGSVVTLDVWATVTGAGGIDPSKSQALQSVMLNMKSTGVILGDYAAPGLTSPVSPWAGNGSSSVSGGFPANNIDLDADGDKDVGSTNNADATGWYIARAAGPVGTANVSSASFMLGMLTFTPSALGAGTATNLQVAMRNAQDGALWFEDGTSAAGSAGGAPNVYYNQKDGVSGATALGAAVVLTAAASGPANSEWTFNAAGGNWNTNNSWNNGTGPIPGSTAPGATGGDKANFLGNGDTSGIRAVSLDSNETIGGITFNPGAAAGLGYTISPAASQTLTINNGGGPAPVITSTTGTNTIAAAVTLSQNTTVSVATGSILQLSSLNPTASALTKTDLGVLQVDKLQVGALSVNGGKVAVNQNPGTGAVGNTSGTSVVSSLAITGAGSQLDLGDHKLIVTGGAANITTLNGLAKTGYASGAENGDGINTSAPLTFLSHVRSIGVAANNLAGGGNAQLSTFAGQSVTAADALIGYTFAGDANMDGTVSISDFALLQNNYSASAHPGNKLWQDGDFNYDGDVNISDFAILQNNFNQGTAGVTAPPLGGVSAVPEPASLSLLGLGAIGLMGRRRRK